MAGHIQDRWYKVETGADGKTSKVKTDRFGVCLRYRARYIGPDGSEKSKSFPDKQKRKAEQWLANVEADMSRGDYVSPDAGKVTFQQYATEWMTTQITDPLTRESVESRLRLHAIPYLGTRPMGSFTPSHLRLWLRTLEDRGLSAGYRRGIFAYVSTVFTAAVEDRVIRENPCRAWSVRAPRLEPRKVKPWSTERVMAVRAALPDPYQALVSVAAGLGLRQGEAFGLAVEDVDFLGGVVHVVRQVKLLQRHRPVFAPPKGGKERDVPLPESVAFALAAHLKRHPATEITCGRPSMAHRSQRRCSSRVPLAWPSIATASMTASGVRLCGLWTSRGAGQRRHALRHFYASVLLDAGGGASKR